MVIHGTVVQPSLNPFGVQYYLLTYTEYVHTSHGVHWYTQISRRSYHIFYCGTRFKRSPSHCWHTFLIMNILEMICTTMHWWHELILNYHCFVWRTALPSVHITALFMWRQECTTVVSEEDGSWAYVIPGWWYDDIPWKLSHYMLILQWKGFPRTFLLYMPSCKTNLGSCGKRDVCNYGNRNHNIHYWKAVWNIFPKFPSTGSQSNKPPNVNYKNVH